MCIRRAARVSLLAALSFYPYQLSSTHPTSSTPEPTAQALCSHMSTSEVGAVLPPGEGGGCQTYWNCCDEDALMGGENVKDVAEIFMACMSQAWKAFQ